MPLHQLNQTGKSREAGRSRTGAVTVEFAFLLPVLVAILLGALEIGNMVSIKSALQNAAREGARRAVLPQATLQTVINSCNQSLTGNRLAGVSISISPTPSSAKSGTMISVSVSVQYSQNSWLRTAGILGDRQLASTVVMRKE